MSDDHSEFQRGQIEGLQHICALIVRHVLRGEVEKTAFARLLGEFESSEWGETDTVFLQGVTHSFSEVSLKIF